MSVSDDLPKRRTTKVWDDAPAAKKEDRDSLGWCFLVRHPSGGIATGSDYPSEKAARDAASLASWDPVEHPSDE